MNDFQVRDHVLDLGPLVEGEASDDVVLQLIAAHRLFKQPRLRVDAIKHRRPRAFSLLRGFMQITGNPVRHEQSLVLAVGRLVVADVRAALARGPQALALALDVIGHHRRCCLQNVLRRAVVLLQADDLGLRKIFFKLENIADVCPAPGVNRLILVAYRAHVVPCAGQHTHQFVLRAVGVLIFVYQDVPKTPVVVFVDFRHSFQQTHGLEQQIVEVECVRFPKLLAIRLVDVGHALRLGIARLQINFLWIEHVVFRPGNVSEHGAGCELLVVQSQPPHDRLD